VAILIKKWISVPCKKHRTHTPLLPFLNQRLISTQGKKDRLEIFVMINTKYTMMIAIACRTKSYIDGVDNFTTLPGIDFIKMK
jgi:hypothetical protein